MKLFLKLLLLSVVLVSCQNKEEKLIEQFLEEETEIYTNDLKHYLLTSIFLFEWNRKEYSEENFGKYYFLKKELKTRLEGKVFLELKKEKEYFLELIESWFPRDFKNNVDFDFLDYEFSEKVKRDLLQSAIIQIFSENVQMPLIDYDSLKREEVVISNLKIENENKLSLAMKYGNILDFDTSVFLLNSENDSTKVFLEELNSFSKINFKNLEKGNYTITGNVVYFTKERKVDIPFQKQLQID
ncbi:hypothetical protein [Aureivirga sp. CE67]|uniref:hypothetical protein n=1 Tax=Aureivirga sp. CE67 TaxID=1788983 RepID=UPI0018CA9AB5|nr:hypothetical protein [Aureivirga sp. CE67]